jgi:hypothetical protein
VVSVNRRALPTRNSPYLRHLIRRSCLNQSLMERQNLAVRARHSASAKHGDFAENLSRCVRNPHATTTSTPPREITVLGLNRGRRLLPCPMEPQPPRSRAIGSGPGHIHATSRRLQARKIRGATLFDGVNSAAAEPSFVLVDGNEIKEVSDRPIKSERAHR